MMVKKGMIALDIDGTSAMQGKAVPEPFSNYLSDLHRQGWQIFFVTGRTLSYAKLALTTIDFPILLGIQNGADMIEYPSYRKLYRRYMDISILQTIESLYQNQEGHYIIYSGFEHGDFCYYNPDRYSQDRLDYLKKLMQVARADWVKISGPKDPVIQKQVPLIKCFGSIELLQSIEKACRDFNTSIIRDTIDPSMHILLITAYQMNKAHAVEEACKLTKIKEPIIVAGDDRNDIAMLRRGTYSIGVKNAPQELLDHADAIADLPSELGVMKALQKVIDRDGNFRRT
ncbi:MAG: Cof-type HAD-IIB family hydrolase [Simkaniaceae bacterium]|nr:Cof-type HAD-IIB family hydrolase [Simkaniaceae bacterium]MCF7852838.1 Cof-type HAD-IIB family hydrolase [Simkaniaceae bacterium]